MQIFEQTISVVQDDLDDLDHVNNVRYVQWIQDIAKAHWQKRVPVNIQDSYYWVVLEHHIHYKQSAILDNEIIIKTYVTKAEGVTSTRVVEMHDKDSGKLIVKAETVWCLLSRQTHRPVRITQEIAAIFN